MAYQYCGLVPATGCDHHPCHGGMLNLTYKNLVATPLRTTFPVSEVISFRAFGLAVDDVWSSTANVSVT